MLAHPLVGTLGPEFSSITGWINGPALTMTQLKGKVVFLDFWTFDCFNCIHTRPHMKRLSTMFASDRFIMIGVHTPEFEFEKNPENVADAVKRFGIEYPVALDSENVTWKLYGNHYWPRQTLIDATGRVRWEHVGEGDYDKMENKIRELLKETR
jgi:thiol-disulfide isomerase/thioredoxin